MIHAHYRALMSAKDAKAFFEIMPGSNGGVARATARKAKGKIAELSDVMAAQAHGERRGNANRTLMKR